MTWWDNYRKLFLAATLQVPSVTIFKTHFGKATCREGWQNRSFTSSLNSYSSFKNSVIMSGEIFFSIIKSFVWLYQLFKTQKFVFRVIFHDLRIKFIIKNFYLNLGTKLKFRLW